MTKVICTTTINAPTEALLKFAAMEDWHLVIAGDLKTPHSAFHDFENRNKKSITYLTPCDQEKVFPMLSQLVGWNCIQRRNLAFAYALVLLGADLIASVDDDNIPDENWGKEIHLGEPVTHTRYDTECVAFDPLSVTSRPDLWHRGFPIQWLHNRGDAVGTKTSGRFDIQANLWTGEPDVDAICRMTKETALNKLEADYPFTGARPAPFNSQNTILTRKAALEYFMFPGIGRMDDIWAAFYLQARGFKVLFHKPTVYQARNVHDNTEDMKAEYLGYENNHKILFDLTPRLLLSYLPKQSRLAFDAYRYYVGA
jgi:hypothetical protein